jgi:geranylgeranyl diphosphate synthase, type I
MIEESLKLSKQKISDYLTGFFNQERNSYTNFSLDETLLIRLRDFSLAGKMNRGGILIAMYEALAEKPVSEFGIICGAALELLESGLLIHDDIMDEDDKRRGKLSIHTQIAQFQKGLSESKHNKFGSDAAMCLGDVAFFLAFQILSQLTVEASIKTDLLNLFSRELAKLCFSQVEDLRLTGSINGVSEKEILAMYAGKTSRYTWTLPLLAALSLSGKSKLYRLSFEKIGFYAGLIYQLIDDDIGLFGDEKDIGKSVGSDVREGKKTPLFIYTISHLNNADSAEFLKLYGKNTISLPEIALIRQLVIRSGAKTYIDTLIEKLEKDIEKEIGSSTLPDKVMIVLRNLVSFFNNRKK